MAQLYYTPYTIQASQITGTLTNWPALVSWTSARFKSVSNGGHVNRTDGHDLVPYADSGLTTKLDFEREFYDPASGQFIDWVKIPSAAVSTTIYYGYGDTGITTDQSNATAVWDSDYGFVLHLRDGSTLSLSDSTSNAHNGTNHGATATAGQIDGGAAFVASSTQYADVADFADLDAVSFTVQGLIKLSTTGANQEIMRRDDGSNRNWLLRVSDTNKLQAVLIYGGIASVSSSASITDGAWHWAALVATGAVTTTLELFLDGVSQGTALALGTNPATSTKVVIGNYEGGAEFLNGSLDEQRYSKVARSGDWLAAECKSQSDQATFWGSLQSEVPVGGGAAISVSRLSLLGVR